MYHLGVVDEGVAGAGVGGQLAGAGQLQALDDRLRMESQEGSIRSAGCIHTYTCHGRSKR